MTNGRIQNNPPPLPDGSSSLAMASTFEVDANAAHGVERERDRDHESLSSPFGLIDATALANALLQQIAAEAARGVERERGKLFLKMNPPVFRGYNDREEAIDWLLDIEKLFEVVQFDEDRKVHLGTNMLREGARHWWTMKEKQLTTPVDWKGFRELFEAEFYSQPYRDRKVVEFLNLKQRDMSVNDYAKRFIKLSRFALSMVANEYVKAKQFEKGLRLNIRSAIEHLELRTYRDVFETAVLVEREQSLSQRQQPKDQKRKYRPGGSRSEDGPSGNSAKKPHVPTSGSPPPPDESSLLAAKAFRASSTYRDSSLSTAYFRESNPLRSSSPSSTELRVQRVVLEERYSDEELKELESFLELNPPVFRGDGDPQDAFNWLSHIERLFHVVDYDDRRRVRFGTFMLRGGANYWWTMKKEQLQAPVNWKGFCELFEADFYIQSYRDQKFAEFLNLKQRNLSVYNYEDQFDQLSCFALFMVADEYTKAKKFEMGLRPNIRSAVALFRHRTYKEVVETAAVVESVQSSRGSGEEGHTW